MPRKKVKKERHKITPDLILDLYKHTKTLPDPEKEETVEKVKGLVKYIGSEISIDLHDIKN
jgi:hypothetical protein|tara:strand:+ start:821 stop:1003 length:183 start_codon:yes stop_codon:yes gene_type:complete